MTSLELRSCNLANLPNEKYLPWLVENVGKQGKDWDWWFAPDGVIIYPRTSVVVKIVFRRGKESAASMVLLKWGNGND